MTFETHLVLELTLERDVTTDIDALDACQATVGGRRYTVIRILRRCWVKGNHSR